jgi:hypothetical protein
MFRKSSGYWLSLYWQVCFIILCFEVSGKIVMRLTFIQELPYSTLDCDTVSSKIYVLCLRCSTQVTQVTVLTPSVPPRRTQKSPHFIPCYITFAVDTVLLNELFSYL